MAVPFYLPEGGSDDAGYSASGPSSDGASSSSSSASSSQSPNTTSSATQTPAQSPLVPDEQLVRVLYEALYRVSVNSGIHYSTPPSPSWSMHSPTYSGAEIFFPRGRSTPRTPRTSVSFAAGEEVNFFRTTPSTSQNAGGGGVAGAPQSAPPTSHHHHHQYTHHSYQQQQQQQTPYHLQHPSATYYQYTPPPTPTTSSINANASSSSSSSNTANASTSTTNATQTLRMPRLQMDATRRSRLTSTGEDEREYLSEHETSWDELDERFDNFTAGRERLQEFNGRIPPRKKKKEVPKSKSEKKEQSFTWPAVVTVFVFAMGCGFLVAR